MQPPKHRRGVEVGAHRKLKVARQHHLRELALANCRYRGAHRTQETLGALRPRHKLAGHRGAAIPTNRPARGNPLSAGISIANLSDPALIFANYLYASGHYQRARKARLGGEAGT